MRTIDEITSSSGMSLMRTEAHAKSDLQFFLKHVIGAKLSDFHYEELSLLYGEDKPNRYVCVISPRGHLKTTLFSIYYVAWKLYRENKFLIAISSSTMDQGKRIMSTLRDAINDNELLEKLMPKSRDFLWNKTEISTVNRNHVAIKMFGTSVRGTQVDLYVFDDVLRDLENMTQEQAKDIFWGICFPCVQARKGQIVVVGTPQTTDDLLADITGEDDDGKPMHKDWKWKRFSAASLDENGNLETVLWPENFTIDELRGIRSDQGPLRFDREYLCNPLSGGSSIFQDSLIKRQMISFESNIRNKTSSYFLGMDMAISRKDTADFTVFTVIEKDKEGIFWQRKMERFKSDNQAFMIERIKALHKTYNFRKILLEDVGLSQGLVVDASREQDLKFAVEGFKTGSVNKEELISHLLSGLQSGELNILNNPILLRELGAFGIKKTKTGKQTYEALGGHDDCVISLSLAFEAATTRMKGRAGLSWV